MKFLITILSIFTLETAWATDKLGNKRTIDSLGPQLIEKLFVEADGQESYNLYLPIPNTNDNKKSLYQKIKKNSHFYYVHDAKFESPSSSSAYEDLGILCNVRYNSKVNLCSFEKYDLYQGILLTKSQFPLGYLEYKEPQIIRAQNKIFVLLKKEPKNYKMAQFSLTGDLEETFNLSNLDIIDFCGNVGEPKGIGFLYNKDRKHFFSIFCPKEGKVITEFLVGSGWLKIIGQQISVIDDFENSDNGSITLYNPKNGKVLSKIKAKLFPFIASVEDKLFYKTDSIPFVGLNVKENKIFIKEKELKSKFDQVYVDVLDKDIWLFDTERDSLTAYQVIENKIKKMWSFCSESSSLDLKKNTLMAYQAINKKIEKMSSFSLDCSFDSVLFSLDKNNKKLWGIHTGAKGHHIYKWNVLSGKLEVKDTLILARAAKIMAFHPDGVPIIWTSDNYNLSRM